MPVVLTATDTDAVADEVDAALADDATKVVRVRAGADVLAAVVELEPDLVVLDMQIGNMGAIAVAKQLAAEAAMGRVPFTDVLLLLDREADSFLARRADVAGWLIKPLDAFRLRRAARAIAEGDEFVELPDAQTTPAS